MATWEDLPLNNKQFEKVSQHVAKIFVTVGNNLIAAIDRNSAAVLAQTAELVKARLGHGATSPESIEESVTATFDRMK
jgi:hypothetical protein